MHPEWMGVGQRRLNPQTAMYILRVYTEAVMGKEYTARSFKSGNSVAIRLPKELGIEAGQEFVLVLHEDRKITAIPANRRKEHFLQLAGTMSKGWMQDGRLTSDGEVRGERGPLDDAA